MKYLLQRVSDGFYVSMPGAVYAYTKKKENARRYPTEQAALCDKCSNERVIEVKE